MSSTGLVFFTLVALVAIFSARSWLAAHPRRRGVSQAQAAPAVPTAPVTLTTSLDSWGRWFLILPQSWKNHKLRKFLMVAIFAGVVFYIVKSTRWLVGFTPDQTFEGFFYWLGTFSAPDVKLPEQGLLAPDLQRPFFLLAAMVGVILVMVLLAYLPPLGRLLLGVVLVLVLLYHITSVQDGLNRMLNKLRGQPILTKEEIFKKTEWAHKNCFLLAPGAQSPVFTGVSIYKVSSNDDPSDTDVKLMFLGKKSMYFSSPRGGDYCFYWDN